MRLALTRLAIAICLVLGAIAPLGARSSPPPSISLEQYILELDRCSAAIASAQDDPATLHELQMSLPTEWIVAAPNQQYRVSTDWLIVDLAKVEASVHRDRSVAEQAQREILSHRDAAQELAQSVPARSLEESKGQLNRILAAKEFQAIHGPSWFDILRARIADWIVRQFEKLFGKMGHGRAIGNAIAWAGITVAALLLLLWVVRTSARSRPQPGIDLHGAQAAGQDSMYWMREARAASARGEYRLAIHAGYWAAIARLEEAKLLTENRSRTPRESLRLLPRERAEYTPLLQLTRRFELVWYGGRPADLADWSDTAEQLEKLGCLRPSTPAISAS